jgi:NAD(P)-dependent dehydrogenase (short-subunit alcohol dehydrogenase family)
MELGLKGKTALVTGTSEGIGMAVARKLAEEGVRATYINGAALVVDGSKSLVI